MVGGHPSRTCPGKPGAALARGGQAEGRLGCLAVSVPCGPHLQLPAGRGRCPVRQSPLPLGPGSLPARRRASLLLPKSYRDFVPQLARRLQAPIPHGLLIGWEGLRCPGSPCPQVPSGPRAYAPCAALSWMAVRASSRACSPSREGPAGEQSMVTDGTPSGTENCWVACPVGLERGCS